MPKVQHSLLQLGISFPCGKCVPDLVQAVPVSRVPVPVSRVSVPVPGWMSHPCSRSSRPAGGALSSMARFPGPLLEAEAEAAAAARRGGSAAAPPRSAVSTGGTLGGRARGSSPERTPGGLGTPEVGGRRGLDPGRPGLPPPARPGRRPGRGETSGVCPSPPRDVSPALEAPWDLPLVVEAPSGPAPGRAGCPRICPWPWRDLLRFSPGCGGLPGICVRPGRDPRDLPAVPRDLPLAMEEPPGASPWADIPVPGGRSHCYWLVNVCCSSVFYPFSCEK